MAVSECVVKGGEGGVVGGPVYVSSGIYTGVTVEIKIGPKPENEKPTMLKVSIYVCIECLYLHWI